MPGKQCCYGDCKSDSQYPDRNPGVKFFPFPKPIRRLGDTEAWIKACGRPYGQLNLDEITEDHFVCSKHFVEGKPTVFFPYPMPYSGLPVLRRRKSGNVATPDRVTTIPEESRYTTHSVQLEPEAQTAPTDISGAAENSTMEEDLSKLFVRQLVKSIQALCHGYFTFTNSIEVVGHLQLKIDNEKRLDYVLTEEVTKSSLEESTMFVSRSFYTKPANEIRYAKLSTPKHGVQSNITPTIPVTKVGPPKGLPTNNAMTVLPAKRTPPIAKVTLTSPPNVLPADAAKANRRKTHQVPRVDESAQLTMSYTPSLPTQQTQLQSTVVVYPDDTPVPSDGTLLQNAKRKAEEVSLTSGAGSLLKKSLLKKLKPSPGETVPATLILPSLTEGQPTIVSGLETTAGELDSVEIKLEPSDDPECASSELADAGDGGSDAEGGAEDAEDAASSGEVDAKQEPYPVLLHKSPIVKSQASVQTTPTAATTASQTGIDSDISQKRLALVSILRHRQTAGKEGASQEAPAPTTSVGSRPGPSKKRHFGRSRFTFKAKKRYHSKAKDEPGYKDYTPDDMEEAIKLVHSGLPVIDAALQYGIPRASLFIRSRNGCSTHTGRCSEVYQVQHNVSPSEYRKRPKMSQYTAYTVEKAIEAVHNGMPVIDASILFRIPRATLFIRSSKGCPSHTGRCSTVYSNGRIHRTKTTKHKYLKLMQCAEEAEESQAAAEPEPQPQPQPQLQPQLQPLLQPQPLLQLQPQPLSQPLPNPQLTVRVPVYEFDPVTKQVVEIPVTAIAMAEESKPLSGELVQPMLSVDKVNTMASTMFETLKSCDPEQDVHQVVTSVSAGLMKTEHQSDTEDA